MIRPLRWAGHPILWLHRRHPWWFTALSTAFVVVLGLLIDVSTNGTFDQSFRVLTVAIGWCAGMLAATCAGRRRGPGPDEWMNEPACGNAWSMTADSDDVAETANRKPKGSLTQVPTAVASRAATDTEVKTTNREHLTGEHQAAENLANESPA